MFIVALFIIPRRWKELRCPSREEWIQKMWYMYTVEYYKVLKTTHDILRQMGESRKYLPK